MECGVLHRHYLFELKQTMRRQRIAVLCMQVTLMKASPHYVSEDGSATEGKEHASVGFIVAPWVLFGSATMSQKIMVVSLDRPLKVKNMQASAS